jgi:tripartite-type tricarboxylate transporter receptor subunit TctC
MDYRPGAAGRIAAEAGARAEPDGYTFFMTSSAPHGVVPAYYKQLKYDPIKSFAPVARLSVTPNVLYVRNTLDVKSVGEFLDIARREPGKLNFAFAGFGTTMHLSTVLVALKSGVKFTNVPYKGGSEVLTAALAGTIDAAFESLPVAKPQIEAGTIRALAIASPERSRELPDLPTMAEAGLNGVETLSWYGILAPARTPQSIIDRLTAEIAAVLQDPAIATKLRSQLGSEPSYLPPAAFQDYYKSEIAAWEGVIKEAGIARE